MAILKMKKLSLITPHDNAEALAKELMWLSCVETEARQEDDPLPAMPSQGEREKIEKRLKRLADALEVIAKYRVKKGLFNIGEELSRESFDNIADDADTVFYAAEGILAVRDGKINIKNKINMLNSQIAIFEPWRGFDLPFDRTSTTQADIIFGTLPLTCPDEQPSEATKNEGFYVEEVSLDREQRYICVYCLKRERDNTLKSLEALGFVKTAFPRTDGTAKQIISKIQSEVAALENELEVLEARLREYGAMAERLERLYDYENSRLNIAAALEQAQATEATCIIRGWVPEDKIEKLEKTLENRVCFYELSDPSEGESPPIKLKNNKFAAAFEGLIGLYSYPDYYGYDPLKYMSIFYCIIFGMMLADFVYGLILTVGCYAMIKLTKPSKGMKAFLEMFALSGISTAIFGLLFGSILGDLPSAFSTGMLGGKAVATALLFDPTKKPMALLYLSFVLGAIHLLWGMGLKAYMLFKRGRWIDAVCDIFTWYLLFLGIGVLAAGVVLEIKSVFEIGKWLSIIGVLSLILTQGRAEKNIIMKLLKGIMSLYDIVSYISDLLSYSRILALSLATAVISSVINIMATLTGPSVIGFIVFVVILVLGHALNLSLNVLGSFVHASRLQYIEFFGKFYEDGGRPFSPLSVGAKYTRIKTEEN